jgi:hypothetical protein
MALGHLGGCMQPSALEPSPREGPLKNELLSTSVASVQFEGGLIKSLRSEHLRQLFEFSETIEVKIDGTRYQLGIPEQSETYRERTTIDDFLSGNDAFPEIRSMEIIRHTWLIAGVRVEREVLLTSLESDDCVLYLSRSSSLQSVAKSSVSFYGVSPDCGRIRFADLQSQIRPRRAHRQ